MGKKIIECYIIIDKRTNEPVGEFEDSKGTCYLFPIGLYGGMRGYKDAKDFIKNEIIPNDLRLLSNFKIIKIKAFLYFKNTNFKIKK